MVFFHLIANIHSYYVLLCPTKNAFILHTLSKKLNKKVISKTLLLVLLLSSFTQRHEYVIYIQAIYVFPQTRCDLRVILVHV